MSDDEKHELYPDVLVDSNATFNRDLLNSMVGPNAKIYVDTNPPQIAFTPVGHELTVRQKLLVYLLAKKILVDIEKIEMEGMSPSQIEDETGISGGTIRPILGKLAKARLIQKDDEKGGYYVPNYSLERVHEELEEN